MNDQEGTALNPGDEVRGVLETYTVVERVGEGGFGVTYSARRASNESLVILKQLRVDKLDSWKALELFEREARALSMIDHPRIPAYAEFFAVTSDGPIEHTADATHAPSALVLVQEYVAGRDLSRRLADGESLTPDALHRAVRQVLEALSYLHELSPPLVHRDVTPKNIIVDNEHNTFLVDFGAIQHRLRESTVGGSTTVGTLGYMPIEQSLGKARPSSDLYALAVTATVMLTGMQPEELPLDDSTGKIDLARLGLVANPADTEQRKRLLTFIDCAIEPIVGQRVASARAGIEILDGKTSIVVAPQTAMAVTPRSRTLFLLVLGGSIGSAAIIYPMNFNNFSETQLVQMAPFWVLPAAFGLIGLLVQHTARPVFNAILGTIATGLALIVFLFGIFPSL